MATNGSKHLALALAGVVLAIAIGVFWLVGGKKSGQSQGVGATTETAAETAGAGARVTPTEPKRRIEPK